MKLVLIATVALLGVWGTALGAQTRDRPQLRASPLPAELVLDGRMREPAWATADSGVLTEFEPAQGVVPPERTVVKVLASADLLVVGIRCDDPAPDRITSFARARDADLSTEDHVRLVLDPFLNGQSGYVFAVNPDGARYDALITELAQRLGGRENPNWDAIWEAAAARSPRGAGSPAAADDRASAPAGPAPKLPPRGPSRSGLPSRVVSPAGTGVLTGRRAV